MISVEEALKLVKENLPFFHQEVKSLAHDLIADRDYPPFHRVMMDGIAIKFNVYKERKREFSILGIAPAGEPQKTLSDPAGCLEVMTGAPLPVGADLVIQYEHLFIQDGIARITTDVPRTHMENVHLKGSDARKGDVLLKSGNIIHGPHVGIAASVGTYPLRPLKSPRINIISTGDELVDVNETPMNHQIRRSNSYALKTSLELFGYHDIELSHLPDHTDSIKNHYNEAKDKFDLLIYSGGVSKGKFDYLPTAWKELGVAEIFHGISQRPGKPLWFGMDHHSKTTVIGLPGNPVSGLVCLHKYVLPHRNIYAELSQDIVFKKNLTYFIPVKLEFTRMGTLRAHPVIIKNSGEFTALAGTDGFIELPKEQEVFKAGETFLFHPWRPM